MYKEDLALNNLQWLICHKTQLYQSFFVLFCIFFEFSNFFINTILKIDEFYFVITLIKSLCIIMNFFVLWSISLCFSHFVHFKKDPLYHTRWTAQIFIHLMRFLQQRSCSSRVPPFLPFLFDSIHFSYFQIFIINCNAFLIWWFCFFCYFLSLSLFFLS